MLSRVQRHAIEFCLHSMNTKTHQLLPWPGPVTLVALQDSPVPGHRDPTARSLVVVPLHVAVDTWSHPDGPLAGLREVVADMHHPAIQATVSLAGNTGVTVLAWAFQYPACIADEPHDPVHVRLTEAVDADGNAYVLSHLRGAKRPALVYPDRPDEDDGVDALVLLHKLITVFGPQQST